MDGSRVIEHKPYDHKVDVFSFGVLRWELLTGKGLRPTIPRHTPPKLGELLERCWQQDPSLRPEFSQILDILRHMAKRVADERMDQQRQKRKSPRRTEKLCRAPQHHHLHKEERERNYYQMAQSQREVVIKPDDINGSPCSNNFQGRSESLRRRIKELSDQENHQGYLNLGGPEVIKCSSNVSFRQRSCKSAMSMNKSRLIDPQEEPCQSSVNSGRMPEKDQDYEDNDDIDDIPQEYKRMKFSTLTMLQSEALFYQYVIKVLSSSPLFKRHDTEEEAMAEVQELEKARVTLPGDPGTTLLPRSRKTRSECQAKEAANRIFQSVAKPGSECIYLEDVMHFMSKEEALMTMHLFGVAAISKSFHRDWMIVVNEMNILTTVFLRYDIQKIIYPNSILATKPIGKYRCSPDMGDAIDFCINISTPMEKITSMKERIRRYIESKNEHRQPGPMVIMRDVIYMNKLMMSVWLAHRLNYQDMKGRFLRREGLLEEMIKVFKELDNEYRLLPVDVNVQNLPPLVSNRLPTTWKTYAS
ncbi:hypothetical protein CMV_004874 [Castanea mollissima]|uniref:Protein kinase domain-containing protein n=1 Tax=Castanea mollissima TaxID=60419 RepID=A0A8J4RE36_9ROSI|nr:hypothetical protein CMV_004874 [Castanea mollissima]